MNHIEKKSMYSRLFYFFLVSIFSIIFIMYTYNFQINYITLLFILFIPLIVIPILISKDLMHPFNIFLINSQFLFIFNMIEINANKSSFRYGSLPPSYHDTAFFWAILVMVLWFIFMYFGYMVSRKTKTKPLNNSILQITNLKIISVILMLVGVISFLYLVSLQGGFSGIIDALLNRRDAYAGLAYFRKLTTLFSIGAIMLLFSGFKKTSFILICMSCIMLATYGGRGAAFFGSVFPFLICYHYQVRKLKVIKLLPIAIIAVLLAIALGNYRLYKEFKVNVTGIFDMLGDIASSTQGGEILPSLVGSLIKGEIDYQYGSTLVNIIFAPIPRTIWKDKPIIDESGVVGQALMGSNYWGLPPGPYGIAFFNFGFIGVIIIAFLVGYIIYKLYNKFILTNKNYRTGIILYAFIIGSAFDFISTSEQIDLLWYIAVFTVIKILDMLISSFNSKKKLDVKRKINYSY
ncbi:hypothetical protein GCM10010978_21450 [Compostibacillus humi]|uniref:Oligosaccharide repeat unit polymerase n=1 Tax=Compostibacillus humi TaxID=1245525 RepID=A0A8J2XFP5_9BACI|nr:O-antigen polymerase [Compostibacillus humi]GFZ79961.1 hypothetical protein GCM10010978_21450 [Compostibacillus humi]